MLEMVDGALHCFNILIVIFIAILGSLLMRTEYVKERLNKKQEEKESPEEIDGELTGYKRRSSR